MCRDVHTGPKMWNTLWAVSRMAGQQDSFLEMESGKSGSPACGPWLPGHWEED